MKNILFLLLFTIAILQSCKHDSTDLTPSYIRIDSIGLTTNSLQGTSSHSITDAWVYIDGETQGIYELPALFPVLKDGACKITIRPGIKINGIASTRMYYPFFQPIEHNVFLVKDSIINLTSSTTYHPSVVFHWMEDFEDGGISLQRTSKSQVDITKTSDLSEVFEGNYSAKIVLDSNKILFECQSIDNFILNGNAINFLELNYKNNYETYIGIFANSPSQSIQRSILVLNKTNVWKKIYVNLSNAINENMNATDFKIFFGILKDSTDNTVPTVYLDNIKLIHF